VTPAGSPRPGTRSGTPGWTSPCTPATANKGRPTLTRQGPPALRWALCEGAVHAQKQTSPDHAYYTSPSRRIGSGRARLAVARKLARRCHHRLRVLG
jgi:hypothetical protein